MRLMAITTVVLGLFAQVGQAASPVDYQRLRNIDLRDLADHETHFSQVLQKQVAGTDLQGTAELIMTMMKDYPSRFVGPIDGRGVIRADVATSVRFFRQGARGPGGTVDDATDYFVANEDFPETRKNTVFSAEFEAITEEQFDKVFLFTIIIFAHDDFNGAAVPSKGYFFRRMSVRVDWNVPKADEYNRVQILNDARDIPLHQTRFEIIGDILERKVVLHERTFGIAKTFPLGVGSFDIRTAAGMTNQKVGVMTEEFPDGKLVRVNGMGEPQASNTRSRNYPSYYRGRPFFGLRTKDGEYRQIGMHYQIDGSGLTRGFVSHGCIRVRDKDLYQLDAILNEGPHAELALSFLNHQPNYVRFIHPMPSIDNYYKTVVYSSRPSEEKVACERSTYNVRNYGSYHTVADGDCLTRVEAVVAPTWGVREFILGNSGIVPLALTGNAEHVPLSLARGESVTWESDGGDEYAQRRTQRAIEEALQVILGPQREVARPQPELEPVQPRAEHSPEWYAANEKIGEMLSWRDQYCNGRRWVPISATYAAACADWRSKLPQWFNYRDSLR